MLFSNSLKMIMTDRNMSELWQTVGKNDFRIGEFFGFIVWIKIVFVVKNEVSFVWAASVVHCTSG
jgi:hypothetical protein